MASYLTAFWRSLTGTRRNKFDSSDFLVALRPRRVLSTPRRLPTTPTRAHLPSRRPEPRDDGRKSKQCPHCRKTFYVEVPSGRVSKPARIRGEVMNKSEGERGGMMDLGKAGKRVARAGKGRRGRSAVVKRQLEN